MSETAGEPSARVFTWDWKEQPDLAAIAAAVADLSGDRVIMREIETGSDQYAWVVSAAELTDEQAERLLYPGEDDGPS